MSYYEDKLTSLIGVNTIPLLHPSLYSKHFTRDLTINIPDVNVIYTCKSQLLKTFMSDGTPESYIEYETPVSHMYTGIPTRRHDVVYASDVTPDIPPQAPPQAPVITMSENPENIWNPIFTIASPDNGTIYMNIAPYDYIVSIPDNTSTEYTVPFTVGSSWMIKAIVYKDGVYSEVAIESGWLE